MATFPGKHGLARCPFRLTKGFGAKFYVLDAHPEANQQKHILILFVSAP